MAKRFNFDEWLVDTVTVKSLGATIGANGGMVPAPSTKYSNISVSLQPVQGDKSEFFASEKIQATHVALTTTHYDLVVGDLVYQGSNTYEVVYFEDQAGRNNYVGNLFAIYLRRFVGE